MKNKYPNDEPIALERPMTQEQQDLLAGIGNRDVRRQYYRPQKYRATREEKLEALNFTRSSYHIDLENGFKQAVSHEEASQIQMIDAFVLRQWKRNQQQIEATKPGTRTRITNRTERIMNPEKYLLMSIRELRRKKVLKNYEIYKVQTSFYYTSSNSKVSDILSYSCILGTTRFLLWDARME
jgi:hypothetical protein